MIKKRDKNQEEMSTTSSKNVKVVARKEQYKIRFNTKRDLRLLKENK